MKNLEEFINDKGNRKNSAKTKFELLIYGVKDAPELFAKYTQEFKEDVLNEINEMIIEYNAQKSDDDNDSNDGDNGSSICLKTIRTVWKTG